MRELLRFSVVGGICTLLNLAVLYGLVGIMGWHYVWATVVAFVAINAVGFWLNKIFTFERGATPARIEAARYYLVMAASLAANLALMWLLVDVLHVMYLWASLLITVLFVLFNFLAHRSWTFGDGQTSRSQHLPRLLLVTHYYPAHGGGVEWVAGELVQRMAGTAGMPIEWWASATDVAPAWPGVTARPVRAWNVLERRLGIPWPVWSPVSLVRLCRAVRAASVVHVHDVLYPGNLVAAGCALVVGRPLLVTQHLGAVPYRSPLLRSMVSVANRTVVASVLSRAGRVVFIADSARDYFASLCRWRSPPVLIPNGVDGRLYRPPDAKERAAARVALGLTGATGAALFVGRFVEKKGLQLLRAVAGRTPDVRWLFAGWGPLDPGEWQLPNVTVIRGLHGLTLRELYWAADVLVLPSVGEGFPLVVQEAMSCGLQALVSPDVASGSEAARPGLEIEDLGNDAEGRWSHRVPEVCAAESTERRKRLGATAAGLWSWDTTAASYVSILNELSGHHAKSRADGAGSVA